MTSNENHEQLKDDENDTIVTLELSNESFTKPGGKKPSGSRYC